MFKEFTLGQMALVVSEMERVILHTDDGETRENLLWAADLWRRALEDAACQADRPVAVEAKTAA